MSLPPGLALRKDTAAEISERNAERSLLNTAPTPNATGSAVPNSTRIRPCYPIHLYQHADRQWRGPHPQSKGASIRVQR
jgi:hypothetical protein